MSPRLRIVTGKGGVGKTAVAAALAVAQAEQGKTVLLCEMRGHDRVAALLQVAPVGARMREVLERVFVVDMNPEDAIHEYVLLTLKLEAVYRAVFENRLVRGLVRLVPSLAELVMLGKLWYHEEERVHGRPRFDALVLDAPSTGHALALLRTPKTIEATVPPGPLREHARNIGAMLMDPARTAVHLVTTPEEMPVNEALELEAQIPAELGIALGRAIINQRLAPLPDGALVALAPHEREAMLAGSVQALEMREAKRRAGEEQLARLPAATREGAISLPRLVAPGFGLAQVRTLASLVAPVATA